MQNYRIIDKIGTGSYSTVFRGEDLHTGEIVAMKVMRFTYASGKKTQDIELKALKKFQSNPCIIKLKEHFLENDTLVLVFELAGIDMVEFTQQLIENERRTFSTNEVRVISYQVAMALAEMHRENYMHRDLKPENILIDPQTFVVKLVDFGLSKKWEDDKNTSYIATRWYRAPQVILKLPYDKSVDVFSLGAVMLEMYLGYGAFPGNDSIDQLNKIFSVTGTPTKQNWPQGVAILEKKKIQFPNYPQVNLKVHLPGLSEDGIDLLTKMIKCNPKQRITINEMIQHPYYKRVTDVLPQNVKNFIYQQIPVQNQNVQKIMSNPTISSPIKSIGTEQRQLIKSKSTIEDKPNVKSHDKKKYSFNISDKIKQKLRQKKFTHDYTGISSDMYYAMISRSGEKKQSTLNRFGSSGKL